MAPHLRGNCNSCLFDEKSFLCLPTGKICGFFRSAFLQAASGNNANLEKAAKPRYTYTYYNKGGGQADVFSFADRALFQPHPEPRHHHGGAGSAAAAVAVLGVLFHYHRYGPCMGERSAQRPEPAHYPVPCAQGREQRLQGWLDRTDRHPAAAGRCTVSGLWQQTPGQAPEPENACCGQCT